MATIAFIAPNAGLLEKARDALRAEHQDVRIVPGLLHKGVEAARDLAEAGVEVIISRGETARAIARELPRLTVIAVPTTGYDVLRAMGQAKRYGRRIAVVAFPAMTAGMGELGALLDLEITIYDLAGEAEAEEQVLRARDEGAQVVVGGIVTGVMAEKHAIAHQVIDSSLEGILAAAAEAKRIGHALDGEKAKSSLLRAVLTYAHGGIIAVDREARITVFNPMAERITRLAEARVLGRPADEVWPELALARVAQGGRNEPGRLVRAKDNDVVCDKIAIDVDGTAVGAVATFHDVRQIQKMEALVRRRILTSGHVAVARFDDILGTSEALRRAIAVGKDYARARATVLILGETGTGKELFAQSIHNHSDRAQGPFVAVNCAALPGSLLESELFGYAAGAFTGASQKGKPGLFELAHGGSIFLDEIAEADPVIQAKLLRVLQEKKAMRLGGDQVLPVDVRVIAATNKNLRGLVAARAFRDDLYYRLNVLSLRIAPLRERREDIPVLARHFLRGAGGQRLSAEAVRVLRAHAWPGNVRELQNVMARAAATLREQTLGGTSMQRILDDCLAPAAASRRPGEEERIAGALAQAGGKPGEAAKLLGISRSTLWRRLRGRVS